MLKMFTRALLAAACLTFGPAPLLAQGLPPAAQEAQPPRTQPGADSDIHQIHFFHEIDDAMRRLPLAAVLGAALALRPRRRGSPRRTPAVVQTQIVLAVVGAVIMLIVGASLARAFAIVGAASLIRYRSKIDDPKDAVVMLSALSIGLASGVGIYAIAIFATVFLVALLWVIESFEPKTGKPFLLKVKVGEHTDELRPQIETILRRYRCTYEIRVSSDEEVSYDVHVPLELQTDRITNALLKLDPEGHATVDWSDKKKKDK
jgi:uncharacterized membrane protein YhiD involved in acid resistance